MLREIVHLYCAIFLEPREILGGLRIENWGGLSILYYTKGSEYS